MILGIVRVVRYYTTQFQKRKNKGKMNKNRNCNVKCVDCENIYYSKGNASKRCDRCKKAVIYYKRISQSKKKRYCIFCKEKFEWKVHNQLTCGEFCRFNYYKEKFGREYISPKLYVMLSKIKNRRQEKALEKKKKDTNLQYDSKSIKKEVNQTNETN